VRVHLGGQLARALPDGPAIAGHGTEFKHVPRGLDTDPVPDAPQALDDATVAALGAYGSGRLDAAAAAGACEPRVRLYDPSTAHADLVRGSRVLAPRFFPRVADVVDLDVAVVGAGIAGLAAAHALAPRQVTAFEREAALGGTARAGVGFRSRFP